MTTFTQGENRDTSSIAWEPWIQTYTGIKFHFISGKPDEVNIEDIATAISRVPRWAGHTSKFYSTAQHSVAVSRLVEERLAGVTFSEGDPLLKEPLKGLLHDATEAYMCDIPSPLKRLIPEYKEIENKVWRKISKKFFGEVLTIDGLVKECDTAMLATEARDLFTFPPIDNWVRRCPPPDKKIIKECWGPEKSRRKFLERFEELTSGT